MNFIDFSSLIKSFPVANGVYPPDLSDLYSLYSIVRSKRVVNILEYGSGFSTLAMAYALNENAIEFGLTYSKRVHTPKRFGIESIDASRRYSKLASKRMPENLKSLVYFRTSRVKVIKRNAVPVLEFAAKPLITPDLIYLDGPDPDQARNFFRKSFRGARTRNPQSQVPICSDILELEFYLQPGTIIVIDGRGANSEYLKLNLKRKWHYSYLGETDQHIFTLTSNPWGERNTNEINFRSG